MDWTKIQGLNVLLNIHLAITSNDPYFETANTTAKGLIREEGQDRYFFISATKIKQRHILTYIKPLTIKAFEPDGRTGAVRVSK